MQRISKILLAPVIVIILLLLLTVTANAETGGENSNLNTGAEYEMDAAAEEKKIKLSLYAEGKKVSELMLTVGEAIEEPACIAPLGFSHSGWYYDRELKNRCYFDEPFYADTELFAAFSLNPPEFRISSASEGYDLSRHLFGLDEVSHPLSDDGTFSYEWYRNGEYFSSGEKISLLNVRDSGDFFVKISFTYGQYTSSVTTPSVKISIEKALVKAPVPKSAVFSGEVQFPDIPKSTLYTFDFSGAVSAGVYPVTLTLADAENYRWEDTAQKRTSVNFEITRAKNEFVQKPNVFDVYYLAEGDFTAISRFGELKLSYLCSDGVTQLSSPPCELGEYFALFSVEGTSDYEGLASPLLAFKILEDTVLGISINTYPKKSEYTAFDLFDAEGLSVRVSYSSGKSEVIGREELTLSYQSADTLRFGDGAVKISYREKSVFVPVYVKKADYDISAVKFGNVIAEYTGLYIASVAPEGTLPVGLDGISLSVKALGGGTDAGEYEIRLVFSTESSNYNIPDSLIATLTVTKKKTALIWEQTEFVYNGKKLCPRAYFKDVNGTVREIGVIGGAYSAGENHEATAEEIPNYEFTNPSIYFTVKKADYDLSGVSWSERNFLYDGTLHTVFVSGLPAGVSVGGYANNSFKNAGKYSAEVSLIYDELNYNPPKIPLFEWSISPREYELSGFDFKNSEAVFDGEVHYPELFGSLPVGFDGSTISYSFSCGARHVSDGEVEVEIRFITESSNYKAPMSIIRTVKIAPKPILASWEGKIFTYNGEEQLPICKAQECSITVIGSARDAGEYTARAISDNPDYYISNSDFSFTVMKAENRFVKAPFAADIFEGYPTRFGAEAHFGEVIFKIFKDADLKEEVSEISGVGVYYAVALVPESKNYLSLTSAAMSFSVIEVVPVGMEIKPIKTEFCAFECIKADDFLAFLLYNDGTKENISGENIEIKYERADALRAADKSALFVFGEFSFELDISVSLAVFDMSLVRWGGLRSIYDGEEKRAMITGLPAGLTLLRIEGGVGTFAGEYPAHAVFEYDTENYEEPIFHDSTMIIERAKLPLPYFKPVIYDGSYRLPEERSELWTMLSTEGVRNAGEYKISVTLTDKENYVFVDGSESAVCSFKIIPARPIINVPEIKLYLGQKYKNPSVEVEGLIDGDKLELHYTMTENAVIISSGNPNYEIYEIVEIERSLFPSPEARHIIFLSLLILIFIIFAVVILRRKRYKLSLALIGHKHAQGETDPQIAKPVPEEKEENPEEENVKEETPEEGEINISDFGVPMNPERADALISNSLAKELINDDEECILTSGKRRKIINVDTLSENFSAGERVDVNILKSKSLVPYDTAYIKVLARGVIDKPLYVYANDFSTTAVKMLALTGGKAIRVTTIKIKKD